MTLPRSAAQVLSGHVTLEIRCIDRILLTFRQPRLQYGKGIHGFFCHYPEAVVIPMAAVNGCPVRVRASAGSG